ncbi:hypothetical protein MVEN_00646700 [Mycena venus]|uniref:Protein kinase domain-containing protein n=1 Tax=Mycena venus TaxID=2733690 RepID=A0A8H6YPT3_9AGAR|nr:hypothetical protein MVEN_00646700 [Mycena venus]
MLVNPHAQWLIWPLVTRISARTLIRKWLGSSLPFPPPSPLAVSDMDFDFTSYSSFDHSHISANSTGMFSRAQNFTVTAANLTNVTQYPRTEQADFRMVPLGDIDLQREICLDDGVVTRHRERQKTRCMYSARVRGESTTVATYQGYGAEQEWQEEIAKYISIRHPNILQVRGAASTGNIHATLFHGDLIPLEHFVDKHSHFSTVYIYAYSRMKFESVHTYFFSTFNYNLESKECTGWIRSSTGQFCVDLQPTKYDRYLSLYPLAEEIMRNKDPSSLNALEPQATIIDSLTLSHYHDLCYRYLRKFPYFTVSSHTTVELGAVYFCPSSNRFEDAVAIAFLPSGADVGSWYETPSQTRLEVVVGGWTRLDATDAFGSTLHLECRNPSPDAYYYWTSQANHIFSRLRITSIRKSIQW